MNITSSDFAHYLILVFGLAIFLFSFFFFRHQVSTQIYISFFGSLFYAVWGISHHAIEGRLTKLIIAEYSLLSLLAFTLLTGLLLI